MSRLLIFVLLVLTDTAACYYEIIHILGGDQLTARTRSSKRVCSNATRGKEKLEGLVPVIEDWHAKVCFLGVSKALYVLYVNAVCIIITECISMYHSKKLQRVSYTHNACDGPNKAQLI